LIYAYLLGAAGILAAARFTNTINLGAVLVGILIVIGFAWATLKDKRSQRWEDLYNLADTERKEIQSKFDEATDLIREQKTIIAKLDALQMPIRIVELMNESVVRIDDAARGRLESGLVEIRGFFSNHEITADERSKLVLDKLDEIVQRLPPVIHSGL
jgi:hypothetical protein